MFKNKEEYESSEEILVRKLDLKKAKRILVYSNETENLLNEYLLLNNIERLNLEEIRTKAIESYFK